MKKLTLLILALLLLLSGCSKDNNKPIDFQNFSSDILGSGAFTDQLFELDTETGITQYRIDPSDCKQALIYFSSGATAEELTMFEANDSASLARIKDAVNNRVKDQTDAFKSYVPSEVPKLEKAVVFTRGDYVILIVADNYDAANSVLDKYK